MKVATAECSGPALSGESLKTLKLVHLNRANGHHPLVYIRTGADIEDEQIYQIVWDEKDESYFIVPSDGSGRVQLSRRYLKRTEVVVGRTFHHPRLPAISDTIVQVVAVFPEQTLNPEEAARRPTTNIVNDFMCLWGSTLDSCN